MRSSDWGATSRAYGSEAAVAEARDQLAAGACRSLKTAPVGSLAVASRP